MQGKRVKMKKAKAVARDEYQAYREKKKQMRLLRLLAVGSQ